MTSNKRGAATQIRQGQLRLGELIAALSLAFDLGNDFPLEKALRNALLAVGLGRELGLHGQELSDVYYVAQLRYLGCTAYSHELAHFLGIDELASRNAFSGIASSDTQDLLKTTLTRLGRQDPPLHRVRAIARLAIAGKGFLSQGWLADCEAATRLSTRLHMSSGVSSAVSDVYSSWNGKGTIGAWVAGEDIPLTARIAFLVHIAEIHHRTGGREAAIDAVRSQGGSDLDPQLAELFVRKAPELLEPLEQESVWEAVLDAEPEPRPWIPASRLDGVAQAFGDFADLKSTFTLGHSAAVSRIACAAGQAFGLDAADVTLLRRAGWLHDLGRVSVPNSIWDKRGHLTSSEWERVRLHSYYTERILSQSAVLKPSALAAGMHHERLDGSGYHRAVHGSVIPSTARLLAAADVFQAITEERPHRAARSVSAAADHLRDEVASGRLDAMAVRAVLEVVGEPTLQKRHSWPNGLSDREVEVLRLAGRGKPNREIASALHISENTVRHHVKRIYDKIGVSTRAGAALFGMENDLF